jgi:GntR family transcriptional regulator/MocR family aminotransferase
MSGADFLQLDPADAPPRGVTTWLTARLRTAIAEGRLAAGDRLPPTRVLAAELRIARGAVVEAYQRLTEEGLVDARTRSGTRVRATERARAATQAPHDPSGMPATPNEHAMHPGPPPAGIRWDLNPGTPDLTDFPRAAWLRHERAVLTDTPAVHLGYGDPRGHPYLREALGGWLTRTRGLRVRPDQLIVLNGVAQAFALLAQVLQRATKNVVAVEDPGSVGASQLLSYWGMRLAPVPIDSAGLVVDALRMTDATSVLVTPAHQFPTGVVLAAERRTELVGWARSGRLIIEDDYDADQRYDRSPVAAIQALAPEYVAHTGSTSKSLAPGMRLGWLVPPPAMHDDLLEARRASDICGPMLPQLVLARLIESGDYERHLRRQRKRQRARRDALLAALRESLPEAVIGGVAAGLHVPVTFPWLAGQVDDADLGAALAARGIRVQPLSWHRHTSGPPGLVIGYGAESPPQLAAAARHIAEVVRHARG